MNKNKVLAQNTIILGIGQFIPKIIAMITLPILTRAFSTDEYGIYDLIISFSSLAIPVITLLIQQAVFRFLINEKDEKICKSYITNSIIFISNFIFNSYLNRTIFKNRFKIIRYCVFSLFY